MARSVTESARSGVDRAALDFPATHIAFSWNGDEGAGVRYRTLDRGGRASLWRKAREAHDMEHGRSHYSGVIQVDRPAHVEWRPVERRGQQVSSITLDYLNTMDGTRVSVTRGESARAATTPAIVTRAQWGADESIKKVGRNCRRSFWPVQQLFVHHTAGSNFDPNPRATMRAIYWYHTVRRGWCDIGYNFVIGWNGVVYEGRWARRYKPWEVHSSEDRSGRVVRGAHVSSFNTGSVGISLMGNFSTTRLPVRMRWALVRLLAWEADRHDLPPLGRHVYRNPETGLRRRLPYIAGHRDAGQTACPGGNVYRTLPSIRRAVKRAIGAGRASTSIALTRPARTLRYGSWARLSGRLARRTGTPMPGREVTLYARTQPAAWRQLDTVITAPDGRFSRRLTPGADTRWSRSSAAGRRRGVPRARGGGSPYAPP
jgi:N-acetylmuramoyl-L-alanine amidase-like protein